MFQSCANVTAQHWLSEQIWIALQIQTDICYAMPTCTAWKRSNI